MSRKSSVTENTDEGIESVNAEIVTAAENQIKETVDKVVEVAKDVIKTIKNEKTGTMATKPNQKMNVWQYVNLHKKDQLDPQLAAMMLITYHNQIHTFQEWEEIYESFFTEEV